MKKLGFGLMRLPTKEVDGIRKIDLEKVQEMVDAFMARGYSYYDTAYIYHGGESEVAFRETVVKKYPRDSFTITDKFPMNKLDLTDEEIEAIFATSLERLGVDFIDYYWIHAVSEKRYESDLFPRVLAFIKKKQAEGKIRNIGFSFHDSSAVLEKILAQHPEFDFVQLQINYLDWDDANVEARNNYELCEKYGKKVIVMEPLRGGALVKVPSEVEELFKSHSDNSIPSWGLRFAASPKNVIMVLSGMGTVTQVEENMKYFDDFKPLDEIELEITMKASEFIKKTMAIPCTSCHYCDGCPKDIPIAEFFTIYNNYKRIGEGDADIASSYYENLTKNHGKASDCIACGRCERKCPQRIKITEWLKRVAEEIETL